MFQRRLITWYAAFGASQLPRTFAYSSLSIQGSFAQVCKNIENAVKSRDKVRLVVVSKTKPLESLKEAYDAGARSFGENYIQEMCEKAPLMPRDVAWHFIGHLQSNKAKKLITEVPNLAVVESVGSLKLATKLNNACEQHYEPSKILNVYVQINTSAEDSKSGVEPSSACELVSEIQSKCPKLHVAGLMTIGAPGDLTCFDKLVACREEVAETLGVPAESLELSMGMSGDYLDAIKKGSTSVRVGSSIFGAREYPNAK